VIFDRVGLLGTLVDRFDITAHGERVVEDAHAIRSGGVLLGAHFGSFEAMRAFDRALPGLKIRYLMYEEHAEKTARILNALNPEVAAQVIPVGDGHSAMLAVREALAEGQFVAFLGDRMPSQNPRGQVKTTFFGRDIVVPRAPYLSAILAGVPLILCFCPRTGNRTYDVVFEQIYDGAPVARSMRDDLCADLAQIYVDRLEGMCNRHPHNWFNFFDIWE
jgi:predicted LPLAT superfamily acyltransferase